MVSPSGKTSATKAHLTFFSTSENAVKTHVWIAISTYVLVAIIDRELKVDRGLSAIFQVLSLTLFAKTPVIQALTDRKTPFPRGCHLNYISVCDLWPDSCGKALWRSTP